MSIRVVDGEMRTVRGTSNGNERGNSYQRRARKGRLLTSYAANVSLIQVEWADGEVTVESYPLGAEMLRTFPQVVSAEEVPTARCYRCGNLLWMGTITVDRIIPGCHGGTYADHNIRPACLGCNSETGGAMANGAQHQAKKRGVVRKARGTR